jgi:hypothetical protein
LLSLTVGLILILAGTAQLVAQLPVVTADLRGGAEEVGRATPADASAFVAEARAVTNWRAEAVRDLDPMPLSAMAVLASVERPVVTRCVKLNNYWCIKQARWSGEIGADVEGHVGFATAEHGADAAVKLLRRYYLELDRKSALAIARRWAPAECLTAASGPPTMLAIRGLGNTLRARWLAARRARPARVRVAAKGNMALPRRPAANRVSAVPLRPLPVVSVPNIMAGVGAPQPADAARLPARVPPRRQPTPASVTAAKAAATARAESRAASGRNAAATARAAARASASAPPEGIAAKPGTRIASASPVPAPPLRPDTVAAATPSPSPPSRPVLACAPDERRIQNYAARMVQGLDLQPGDDLKLFDPDGTPGPNLTRVLLSMSSFELGHLRASLELVAGAVERATPRPASGRPNETAPSQ